jgi:hypothetical protein
MANADPGTFHLYDALAIYVADKNYVYWHENVVRGADPQTFTPLPITSQSDVDFDIQYAKDPHSRQIYFQDHVVTGADFETFTVLPPTNVADASDKNHLYKNGSLIN